MNTRKGFKCGGLMVALILTSAGIFQLAKYMKGKKTNIEMNQSQNSLEKS